MTRTKQDVFRSLVFLINLYVKEFFAEKLKLAKVSPVFKKGNKSDMNNYRPISFLFSFFKDFGAACVFINEFIHFLRKIISFMGVNLDFVKAFQHQWHF